RAVRAEAGRAKAKESTGWKVLSSSDGCIGGGNETGRESDHPADDEGARETAHECSLRMGSSGPSHGTPALSAVTGSTFRRAAAASCRTAGLRSVSASVNTGT